MAQTLLWVMQLAMPASASDAVAWALPGQEPESPRPIAVVSDRANTIDFVLGSEAPEFSGVRLSLYGLGGPLAAPLIFRKAVTPRHIVEGKSDRRYRLDVVVPNAEAGTHLLLLLETLPQGKACWRQLTAATLETFPADQLAPVRAFAHGTPIAIDDSLPWLKKFFLNENISCVSLSPSPAIAPALVICSPDLLAAGNKPPVAAVLLILSATDDPERLITVHPRIGGGIVEAHLPNLRFFTTNPRVRQDFLRAFRLAVDLLSSSQTRSDL